MVSGAAIAGILFSIIVSVGLPVGICIYFGVRHKIHALSVLFGALVFLIFVMVLENILHFFMLSDIPATKAFFRNPWAYAAYGGLAAGIFEETGRFLAFTLILKKYREWKDGVAYGIGHGGFEAIAIGALGNVNNLVYALMINNGMFDTLVKSSGSSADQLEKIKASMLHTAPYMFTISGAERIMAFTLQIALSVLLLYGILKGKPIFLLYCILLHAAIDFPAALYQKGVGNVWLVEGVCFVAFLVSVWWIVTAKKRFAVKKPETALE